jgi:hypothetical protein
MRPQSGLVTDVKLWRKLSVMIQWISLDIGLAMKTPRSEDSVIALEIVEETPRRTFPEVHTLRKRRAIDSTAQMSELVVATDHQQPIALIVMADRTGDLSRLIMCRNKLGTR